MPALDGECSVTRKDHCFKCVIKQRCSWSDSGVDTSHSQGYDASSPRRQANHEAWRGCCTAPTCRIAFACLLQCWLPVLNCMAEVATRARVAYTVKTTTTLSCQARSTQQFAPASVGSRALHSNTKSAGEPTNRLTPTHS